MVLFAAFPAQAPNVARDGDAALQPRLIPNKGPEPVDVHVPLRPQASRIDRARTSKTGGNIAEIELLHIRELLLQSGQLVAQAKVFRVPFSVFGRTGRLNLALMKGTPRAQMG